MVGRTERPLGNERHVPPEFAGDGMNLCGFKALGQREGRQNRRQTLGHHRFTGAGRTHHDEVVASGGSHFEGPLHVFLSANVGKILFKPALLLVKLLARVDHGGLESLLIVEEHDYIKNGLHAVDFQFVDHGSLPHILLGHNETFEMLRTGPDGDGQCPFHRL